MFIVLLDFPCPRRSEVKFYSNGTCYCGKRLGLSPCMRCINVVWVFSLTGLV